VVDVTHHHNDRVAGQQGGFVVNAVVDDAVLNGHDDLFAHLRAEFRRDDFSGIVIDYFVDACLHAEQEQFFDDFGGGHFQHRRQFADGNFVGHSDDHLRFFGALGSNSFQALRLGFLARGAHAALAAVLLGFLLEFLLVNAGVALR